MLHGATLINVPWNSRLEHLPCCLAGTLLKNETLDSGALRVQE